MFMGEVSGYGFKIVNKHWTTELITNSFVEHRKSSI